MGPNADKNKTRTLPAGSFFAFEPGEAHYVYTDEETVIQLNSTGPWTIEYVKPADDPRK
jgi:quercetin dioxygenase-like cupin family protein